MLAQCCIGTLMVILVLTVMAESIGVIWGTSSSHRLPPELVVALLKSNNITRVKLLDVDPIILQALSGSGIRVSIGIPNSMISTFNSSRKSARNWVHDNVTRYFNADGASVAIDYVTVGEEPFLVKYHQQYQHLVLGAVTNIQAALSESKPTSKVKAVVPCGSDTLHSNNTNNTSRFRDDLNTTIFQLLTFLDHNNSPFFINILPYPTSQKNTSLDSSVFGRKIFEKTHTALLSALSEAGFPGMETMVETGWPTDGASDATPSAAETFMKGVVEKAEGKRPVDTYVLSLFDEDERGDGYERHMGVFTFDGQAKYHIDFSGKGRGEGLVNVKNVEYLPSRWCVVERGGELSNKSMVMAAICSLADCTSMSPGGSCSNLSEPARLAYAFNAFYQLYNQSEDACSHWGPGRLTTVDPSVDRCRFLVQIQTSGSAFVKSFFGQRCLVFLNFLLLFVPIQGLRDG